eukprot:CAMPEP_0113728190 /NCGR_PEP_ID=MMETSP0038_2-20120614/41716_1 /TAXON_ID=2898 /ORGANISM="Cryptomonas paramecium" /LENGTH=32 /DNA_ID=CAMNT_0000659613 /DNA_START=117 /DNA_END=212 /DNA_ORIENTATION=- /assembly_acc=CAM_ASM_000170
MSLTCTGKPSEMDTSSSSGERLYEGIGTCSAP